MDQSGGNQFQYKQEAPVGAPPSAPLQPPQTQLPPEPQSTEQPQITPTSDSPDVMQWRASEFIDHQKNVGWFVPLIAIICVVAVVAYVLSRDVLTTVVIVLAGAAFGTFAYQKPRTLTYSLLPTSIKIGDKTYSYDDFRSFSIIHEGALYSVFLEPVKRFMPPLSIYFAQEDGEKIFDTLALHIPHQDREIDAIDRFMRKIRF